MRAALGLMVVALASGCGGPREPEGAELVGSWTQAQEDWPGDAMPIEPVLLADEAELEEWIAELPEDGQASVASLRSVDLGETFLVIGGYSRCTEHSAVMLDGDTIDFEVTTDEPNTSCVWAPYTIDAWAVPLAAIGGEVPELVEAG